MSCTDCRKKGILETARNIGIGVSKLIFSSEEITKLAEGRLEKCIICKSSRVVVKIRNKSILQCTECICMCDLKARVEEEKCPLDKW